MTDSKTAAHAFYPVSLDVSGRSCLVVGAGPVASRKVRGLLECGARVHVVATEVCREMDQLAPLLQSVDRRPYRAGDVLGHALVVTATGDTAVDGAVFADAEAAGIWVNSADDPAHCSFILPAVHRDGAVTIAVSTGGLSPALASWLRTTLALQCGSGLGALAEMLADARARLTNEGRATDSIDWPALLDGPLPALVQAGDVDNALAILHEALGN